MALSEGIPGAFERAFVINMAGATERWAAVQTEFDRIGVAPVRIDAVRGKDMSKAEREAACTPLCAAFCTPATIGCGCSHVKLWRRVVEDDLGAALACEDDPTFVDGFRELLTQYAAEFPPDFDVIYLGCFGCTGHENALTTAVMSVIGARHTSRDVSEHVWVPPLALTTHCYIVSAQGARKLLDAVEGRLATHIDKMMNRLIGDGKLNAYAVRPLLAHQEISLSATSIASAKTPRGPSILLDKAYFDTDVTWGYAFGSPFGRVGTYTVNLWTPTFLLGGAVVGALGARVAWALGFAVLLLLADLLPMAQGDRDTVVAVLVNVALALLGWLLGMGARVGIAKASAPHRAADAGPPRV